MNAAAPVAIYEVHPASWMRVPEEQNRPLTADEIAPKLGAYARHMNFTHVGLMTADNAIPDGLPALREGLQRCDVKVISQGQEALQHGAAWANQILDYLATDPFLRKFHQKELTWQNGQPVTGGMLLPLSHNLVTRGQKSLVARMPGDDWQKFANLRLLFTYMYALPGRKLIFMGDEFGQWNPWNPETSLDWHLVNPENFHGKAQRLVARLNEIYRTEPALHSAEANPEIFTWIDLADAERSTLSFLRRNADGKECILAVFNFTPVPRQNFRVGVPQPGFWREILNGDALEYGGSGQGNLGGVEAAPFGWNFQPHSLTVTLPPLAGVYFKHIPSSS